MILRPNSSDARKGVPVTVRVETKRAARIEDPKADTRLFEEAAHAALIELQPEKLTAVSFESVVEFIVQELSTVTYRYVWIFSAWDFEDDSSGRSTHPAQS